MKTIERFLCPDCEKDLAAAGLVYKKIPGTEEGRECDWCGKRRYCTKYRIIYGRGRT